MFDEQDRQYFYNEFKNNGYEVGSYDDFKKDLNNEEDRNWYYNEAKNMGYDVGTQADFDKMVLEPAASASGGGKQVDASATTQSVEQKASTETKPQVAQPAKKQETTAKDPGLIAKVLDMIPTGVQTSNGTYQPSPEIPQPVVKGEEMPVKEETSSSSSANAASPESKEAAPVTTPTGVVNNEGMMDAKLANYLENWKQRPDKQSTYFENLVADLLADGTANSNEEAVSIVKSALGRYANRSAMDVTNQVVSSLPDDTVQDAEKSIEAQWYSHGVQDKLKQEAYNMGISYDDYVGLFLKPAMVQSLVNKYGPKYRDIAEGIATRLYSHDENVQDRLMNQDINDALSSVISKYVNPSVVEEYNKAQEAGSKAFNEGMEGSQFIPANLRLGTALGAQYEANEAKDPAKVLSGLQRKFGKLYRNPEFLNDMSNAAFKVMQRYGLNGTQSSDPKQFKPMINSVLKNELDQLEIKGMMPKGSAEYIMKTGLGNTIVGKITRKAVQTDYQNWLEDIANQQYQPGFWENVASGALTFAGDAWSYWLPGAAGGKLTKSMVAKAEGKLAGDLMAKGMERKMAERAAKVLIGKSKAAALKSGAAHGAVTFGGQSAISKPIDEIYRTGQFDENGKIYNPSVGKVIANTLGEVAKQSAVGAIMQGGTIANMVGKGRGLATNILADIGGKVADSGIMTGHQMLERMAQDPNFKPTGKDAAESFLESMANLTAIGLPGMVGKYARFKDAREYNKKFDLTDQDIAELKRFGYDGLRDAFEKMGIGEYAVVGENAQRLDGQLTQKYMDLMNDKSVPEVLKAKMMAVVEGKRPSSFSPIVDSIIIQPMDNGGKVYLETLNKDGGIVERKEFSSLDEAQKADKKLEYEKTLGLASVLEGEFHNEFTQEHLDGLYNKAAQKYNMGEKLTDEDKAAVYLHQNAGAIKEIMDKQQKGIILTDEEQKQVNDYRHYYDSALENSSVMREFVNTFEDSHGVARGTLRKALESKDKKYSPLVESYLKELYNSIELKREMKQIEDDKKRIEQGDVDGAKSATPVEGPASVEGSAGGQEPPVSEEPAPYQDRTNSVPTPSDAEVAANPANSAAEGAGNEPKVASSDAFVMGQNAYKNGDSEALQAIDYNSDLATGRLKRAFADNEKMPDIVANAYNEGRDMEQFVAQRASSLTPAQKEAISKYVEAMDAKNGAIDALQHADDGYGEALKQQLWSYQTEDGNIVPATLDSGKQVFLKKANEYGGAFVVVPDEQGQPTIKQVSNAEIKEVGTPVSLDEYIENTVAQQKDARAQQFISQFDGSGLKPNDQVTVAMEEGDANINMTFAGYSKDGKIVLTDGKDYLSLSKEEFAAWRKNALDNTINEHLDAEDDEREQEAASQAEADKKQRYANGIVGLSEGQPDYSSKDTDPKVAAEYLQEQFGEDHGKLLNLVNGSRDDIKTQLANKRRAAIEYQNWLDTNADLDPEKAKKVEDELSLVNEQLADLDARFKNWNTIRNSVMTPDEVKAMKEERKAEVEKAGVDESAIVPSDDFHVLVLDDKELKKQYPTMDKATDYITSQRKDIYHTQEDVERKINGVNDMLDQYINGETELDPSQLMELNTSKAQLEALQTNLSVAAKGLKAQANKLSRLYKTEVSKQEMEKLGMTPSEQRKALVADALKKNDMNAIHDIYKDASVDVMDLTPQTLEEAVSESLLPHSLNPESLQYELGKSNFKFGIGKGYDSNKFNYLIAKKGTGMSVNEFAVRVYNDLPVNLQDMGYTDQDVRNALLDMFKSYDSVKEMRNVALMNRIAAAEDELSSEEEYYEAQKEREIIERQAEIEQYKSYIHEKELSLPSESELDHINGLEFDRMMEIEDREREYKQYVKSILPELADYDDRSNEEGYGGGSSLGSDSSRRGVDERNSQGEEVGNGEASSESEIGEGSDSGRKGRQETGSMEPGKGSAVRGSHLPQETSFGERLKSAIAETETEITEAQKKAGNYKKGHLSFGGYDYTVETPKGVTRSGKDEQGKPWSVTMHDTYGYILGKIGVDGDHIDMFINDAADLDTFDGNVYVVDQVNPETGEFDEHKVMYGYPSEEAATEAYLANYSKGWKGLGKVTSVPKATFDKWLESSDRKTKPFAEYAMVQKEQAKFDRDVKEVKPSEMTEAQKVAYDAVSTMLKKAGIPVKVVSNEDMEKVAEAQDNLAVEMLLNDPRLRFYIKTPEQKEAAKAAYDWAAKHRPDKFKQYAIVNMDNPNQPPQYFEKKDLAEKWRKYYTNAWKIGNYKAFNLNKPFEEQIKDIKGDVPSEFDPYKAESLLNKRIELEKQIKETEDSYNAKKKERAEYQNQLMQDYMDQHGLSSENDIPDDVWTDYRDKSFEKYQDTLDDLFHKYVELDNQLKAVAEPGVRFLRTYHGTGAKFDKFDLSHALEGEGSETFGHGVYVTNSKEIGTDYAQRAKDKKAIFGFEFVNPLSMSKEAQDMLRHYMYKHQDVAKGLENARKDLKDVIGKFPDTDYLQELNEILAKDDDSIAIPSNRAYRYDVDIPDDNGSNYLGWNESQNFPLEKWYRLWEITHNGFSENEYFKDGGARYDIDRIERITQMKLESPENGMQKLPTLKGEELYHALEDFFDRERPSHGAELASRALGEIGFVGIKYPAGMIHGGAKEGDYNYVVFDENNAQIVDHTKFAQGKGVVYGYTDGKQIVLNQEHLNPNTPIHEYQHLWRTAAKNMNPELIEHGDKLIMQTQLFADLKQDPNYNHLTDEQICDEAFARLTGEDGAAILEQMAKDAIKENPLDTAKELSVINKLKEWLKKFWYWTLDTFTKWKPEDIKKMTLEDIRNLVLRDLANGVDPRTKLHEAENADDIKFMGSTTKKRMKDISTQLEGRELDEAQQAVADVYSGKKDNVSLTVEREDGSNKIIMRQGNDNHAGTKHSVFRHYGVKANSLNVDDLLLIPTVLKEGERKVSDNGRVAYVYVDPTSQVKYTVVTEPKNNKEFFNDFYSNKKANPSETSRVVENSTNTPEGAHNNDGNAFMDAKVDNNSETAKGNGENLSVEDKIKAVSQQFGVDEADVAMYANAIKKGSTAEAARARANIKRHLMQVNEGNIFSFKDMVKYTVPVNNALKENFGDLDAMIEERIKQVEAERNAMEAARKRAEEEEAKRKKHLEELSLIPDVQLDKQYMDALAKGDDATAREMLDEAARRKGYDDTESSYQGVGAWKAPGNPGYESDKARRDDWESSGSDVNLEDMALGYTPQPDDYFSHPERYSQNTPHGLESVKAINAAIDAIKNGEKDVKVKVYRAVPTSVKESKLRNGDWVTPSKKYAEMHGTNRLEGKYRIIEDEVPANQLWWDGNDANEFGFDDGKEYKYKNAKNNRKLNDLVTYDDKGDVIPPSKRFNSRKSDVRFHRVTEVKSPIVEQKLQKHPDSLMKAGTYFSGGGLVEEGLKGIIDPVVAVEYDRKISGVYRNNFGQHIVTADVRDVDPKELVKHIDGEVEYFHASPVCKNYSQAKSNSGEVELDKETAKSTADFIDAVKPRVVTIENVKGYKDSEAMKIITQALDKNGYKWDVDVYNAADFGGYTSRERLIVRAVKDGELPEKPKKQPRKGGWLEAVEDILPTLTVKESGVAPWMDARLKADGIDWQKVEKPLYVMGSAYADGKIPHAYGDEILPTLRTKSGDVIIMPGGKVLRADGRVLARITGLGDDYKLPKTESLAHTIIGNGIPVQLTQGVIAPLLNKDDLSGRNVLARLGSSIFKNNWDADKQKQVSDRVVNTANKLGGAEATVYTSVDEVPDAYLSDVKNGATGWYDPTTHTVHVYLPNCADANEAERTVLHEKIGHEGMEVLLGGEDGVRKFANFVYRSVGKDVRGKIIDFANKYDPDWKNSDRMNVGTQEYIAHLAEEGPKTAEDFSLWTKIKHYLIKVLKKLGVRVPGLLNDKDLRYYLMKAGKALHVWDNMPKEKQEAMMKQASNAEIKDALSDGAGKGKPRQKKGESTIQYMKRVQEWRKWQNAREDKENPEPPMFYDIDKDEAGKKEWAQLNKDWRERHHLVGEEPTGMPIRMENEEDDAYMNRIHEYEKWQAAMKDQEDPLPDMFAFEKKKQEEVKRKYEDWLAKHDLLEQQQADLDLYEGKIYPAETNPKADALEQQVMQDLAEVTSTDVSKEGAAMTVKHAVIHRRKNMEEASADDAIYINDVKNRIEKMADSGAFEKLLSDYKGKKNRAEKLAETIPYIIEAPRRLRDMAHNLNATGVFDKGHIHIQPADVEAIQPYVTDLITETAKKHTEIKKGKEIEVYDDPKAVSEVASKMAQAINANHQGEEGFVPIDGSDILSEHVLPLVKLQIVPKGIDYKNLSPEMKAALDSIRDWYNYTYDWLRDNHTLREDTGYNADYVNHIWDKEKSDKQAYALYVENRQRTKSPNEKKRTISTLMEGISVGLVPKTTDITKMMAYYSRSNIEAWVNKTMLQELTGLNVIERNEKGEVISTDPLLSSSAPFNLEQYKYFEIPGVGPVWVYNVSPKQVKVKNPITDNEKVIYSEASAGDRFGVVFDTYQSSPFWKTFDTLASSAKKLELGFSGFHAGALTEVYMVQNMVEFGPKKAMANFMKYIFVDTAKNHELPCFANPEDFQEAASHLVKFGATNDYAAADVQNMFDNMRDAMIKVQKKLKDGNKISGTVAKASMPLKVATQMLSLINKGMDVALWDFLHDGLKLATYRMRADKTKERAKKKGWTEEELSRALDEDGQFVNDMFGGQHWDVLGASHRTLRYAGRVLLSPDWNASTTRHFLALTGFGSIWNEATFENFKQYYKRLKHKELTPEDEGRRSRQISALLCYGIGFMVFYEGIANGINAAFRALDEEKERKKAEEIRKTNPSYKSMYELAYGDEGMKWYDYLMRGNSLGQQSKIFLGRYEDGTEMYVRHGKQFREVPEYLFNHKGELEFPGPMVQRMIGKANPMVRMTLDDINYLSDFQASHADQEIQRKYGKTIGLLYKDALYWAPFLIPSQENKEFKAVDFFFPSSKGFSPWKAQSYFKDFILSGDMEGVVMTYQSCQRNGIDPEAQIKAAIGSVKALESAEMSDGVTSLQEASKRFDAAKSITEKKKMRQKMKKFLSQSDYKAFTQKEALDMVQGYLNGDEDLKEMEKAESKYLMKAKAEDVTEDWRIQNVWNGTIETYQEYQRLKDVDKAKANAFKNSKTNKRLFAARKAISAAKRKMNKAKKQMDGTNDAAKLVEIRNTRKELLKTLNGME
jgi:site-specific DNA-cytosine methylase